MGTIQLLPRPILTRFHHTNPTSTLLLPRPNLSDSLGGSPRANSLEAFELRRETYTHSHFFQSGVSSPDLSTDRSTSPYNRSLVSRRPLHRHAPQPFSRRFPRDHQVDYPSCLQSWGDKIETSDPPPTKIFPNTSLVPRGSTTFHISRMVTGLVTVNGNK
jgi:hypothetical protein